jgi:hypothetical protein
MVPSYVLSDAARIAKIAYDVFTDPDRITGNVETYCKSKTCWEILSQKPYELSEETKRFTIDEDEEAIEKIRAQKDQRFDNNIIKEVQVFNFGSRNWEVLLSKGMEQQVLNGHEQGQLQVAIKYANGVYSSITRKQATEILEIKDKLEELGVTI